LDLNSPHVSPPLGPAGSTPAPGTVDHPNAVQINAFYHQRESLLKIRLRALIDQRKLLQARVAGTTTLNGTAASLSRDSSNYGALYEGFRNFERDLGRLQVSTSTWQTDWSHA